MSGTNVPEIDRHHAMRLATNAADEALSPPRFSVGVWSRPDNDHVRLTLYRKIGQVEVNQHIELSRRQTVEEFADACRRSWRFLQGEMEAGMPEPWSARDGK